MFFKNIDLTLYLLLLSVAMLCLTLCDSMDCSMPCFLNHHHLTQSLPKFIFVESVMPSKYLIFFCPLLLLPSIFPSIRLFSSESAVCIRWQKYWSWVSVLPTNIQDWFPLELTVLSSLQARRTFKSLLQHHSSKASVHQHSTFFMVHSYIHTWLLEKP